MSVLVRDTGLYGLGVGDRDDPGVEEVHIRWFESLFRSQLGRYSRVIAIVGHWLSPPPVEAIENLGSPHTVLRSNSSHHHIPAPGGSKGRGALDNPRRRKHCRPRCGRSAWFERALCALSSSRKTSGLSGDSESRVSSVSRAFRR